MPQNKWSRHRPLFSKPAGSQGTGQVKRKWVVLPALWYVIKRMAMVLGFMVLFSFITSLWMLASVVDEVKPPSLPQKGILYLELDDGLYDVAQQAGFAQAFGDEGLTLRDMVDALDYAKNDKRIQGIYVRMNGGVYSSAQVRELREAIRSFRHSKKFAYVYASSYGDLGGGLGQYYLASIFDEIWMQPMGVVSIPGVRAEVPYFRDVLDKIGILPQFFQRKDYKTAYESFQRSEMSDENREMMQELLDDVQAELFSEIAKDRGMSLSIFNLLVKHGLYSSEEAKKVGLITHRDYSDKLLRQMNMKVRGVDDLNVDSFIPLQEYVELSGMRARDNSPHFPLMKDKPKVALVYVSGAIVSHSDDGTNAAADDIVPAIMEAIEDPKIKAIVVRIDSPGGSPVASEDILHALDLAQNEGIKVIVSMGAVAASGGYWIASHADQIFAQPTTITGSIGVVGGKVALQGLWDNIGVNWDYSVGFGENAGLMSFNTPFSESEATRFNAMLDSVYISFLERVSEGRGMLIGDVDKIAGGRVWSGRKAKELRLVDQMGGLNAALDYAALTMNLENRHEVQVEIMPKPKSALEMVLSVLEGEATIGDVPSVRTFVKLMEVFQPFLEQYDRMVKSQDYSVYEPLTLE